tara:strand:+ start:822 stop:2648 length:1827 start_codon:yes stop_codon:yes gene_type:complete
MPRYSKDFIAEIKSRLKVSDVVGKFVKLTQRGNEYVGLSPFKNEKTPSFTVNDEKEFYHCFSSAEHGNIFSFLMKHKNMTYPDSIEYLAKQAGLDPLSGIVKGDRDEDYQIYDDLRKMLCEANEYYKKSLKESNLAKTYIEKRGINNKIIEKFEIGFADNKNGFLKHISEKNLKLEDALKLGLIKKSIKDESKFYDFFRNRLIFPIKDYKSNVIAFGGRTLNKENPNSDYKEAKYINSSESAVFKKSFNLFNLDLALEENRLPKDLLIVEGYMDAVSLYQNNFTSVVAPLGTALTKFQIEKAWKYCKNPIIIFDGDEAGRKASLRAAMLTLSILKPDYSMRFCTLPEDNDPDDFVNKNGIAALKKLISNSEKLSDYIWSNEYSRFDLYSPEQKAGFEKRIKQIIPEIQDSTVRAYYKKDYIERLYNLRKTQEGSQKYIPKNRSSQVTRETVMSERANKYSADSIVREKLIILLIIENPFLISKYLEELGLINFSNIELSKVCSRIVNYIISKDDKSLENLDIKSYLIEEGFQQQIVDIYSPSLVNTYQPLLRNSEQKVEGSFLEFLDLQNKFAENRDMDQAAIDLEENMNEENFEKFLKLKKEILNKN